MHARAQARGSPIISRSVFGVGAKLFSLLLLCVLVLLPLAPLFASEDGAPSDGEAARPSEETTASQGDTREAESSSSKSEHGDLDTRVANEDTIDTHTTATEEVSSPTETNNHSEDQVPEEDVGADSEDDALQTDDSEPQVVQETTQDSEGTNPEAEQTSFDEGLPEDNPETVITDVVDTSSTTDANASTTSTDVAEVLDDEEVLLIAEETLSTTTESSDVLVAPEELLEPTASTTENVITISTEDMVVNDENRFMFGKDECVSVGDGSFYCREATTTPVVHGTDRVFAATDQEGDREIYVEHDGELRAVTSNQVDDDAPFYDELSRSIVWHRLIDGRYQIVSYDLVTNTELVLTRDHYNNMEPSRYGEVTVWQGWVGNDWEVMLEIGGDISMLTDNTYHDIGPRINGEYIMWQAYENDAWHIKVYDMTTKLTETIQDGDAGAIDNPRFVLVYDSKQENGDVETKGYDLASKQIIPLTSSPVPSPDELPDPEQTGEERALVQPTVQIKSKTDTDDDVNDFPLEPPLPTVTPESAGTSTADVVVPPFAPESDQSSDVYGDLGMESGIEDSTAHIPEVVITPPAENDMLETVAIPDLVVPAFDESEIVAADSQEDIAPID